MDIEKRVRHVVALEACVALEKVTADSRLIEDLDMADSLDRVELGLALEDEFGVVIDDDHIVAARQVRDCIALVSAALEARAS